MNNITENQRKYIRSFYEDKLPETEKHHEILGWENAESQQKRFGILIKNVDLSGKKLVDIGCGMGDLLKYIRDNQILDFCYTGVDISERLLEESKKLYPAEDFFSVDLLEQPSFFANDSFDILYSSGIFNLRIGDNMSFFKRMFERFYAITKETIVFNLLSDRSLDKEDLFHYFSKNEIEDYIRTFPLASIEIIDDYLINDFTVICRKL